MFALAFNENSEITEIMMINLTKKGSFWQQTDKEKITKMQNDKEKLTSKGSYVKQGFISATKFTSCSFPRSGIADLRIIDHADDAEAVDGGDAFADDGGGDYSDGEGAGDAFGADADEDGAHAFGKSNCDNILSAV